MKYCDTNSSILLWNSEGFIIPYTSPVDKKQHRYFVDFWVKMREKNGEITQKLIEIKPYAQSIQPKKGRKPRRYINEVKRYGVNQAKWFHAEQFAILHGMEFIVLTEKGIWQDNKFTPSKNKIF